MPLDISFIRKQFPFLTHSPAAVYLDNAATTQKPQAVIDAMTRALEGPTGNVHRGQHHETEVATDAYEKARRTVQTFIGAKHADEIIFTKNCTESINLVMRAWAAHNLRDGDHIAISILEHHSNIIPWLQLKQESGIIIDWINLDHLTDFTLDAQTKLLCVTGQSNVLGIRPDLKQWIDAAHAIGAKVLIDAAQLAAHTQIDVTEICCDFLAFSGHKIYGPTGIGVLYASRKVQKEMTPFMGGGGTVETVTRESFTPADPPAMFEAGTPPIIEAIGLAAAIEWQKQFDWKDREHHDQHLMNTAVEELSKIPHLKILPSHSPLSTLLSPLHHGCISFIIPGIHPHDLTDILGQKGIALRAGHHCAQPLHEFLKIPASTRLSTALYTTEEEIRACAATMKETIDHLRS